MPPRKQSRVQAHRHCHYCGQAYAEWTVYPRTCPGCGQMVWSNPVPVAVAVVRMQQGGVLIIQRGIEPARGLWALPGGFLEAGETWQAGAAREVFEETGLTVPLEDIELVDALSAAQNRQIVLFCVTRSTYRLDDFTFTPCEETLDLRVMSKPEELAFPAHTRYALRFLKG